MGRFLNLKGLISDTISRVIRVDSVTNSLQIIDYPHHEVHSGSSFVVSDVQNVDTTTFKWQITTPNTTKYSHMIFEVVATGEISILVTEGSNRDDGTALTEINRRRIGTPGVAGTIVTHTPTNGSTDGTTTIDSLRTGATDAGGRSGTPGMGRGVNEFNLKPNTKYVVAVETFADIYVTLHLDWYEHTDKD